MNSKNRNKYKSSPRVFRGASIGFLLFFLIEGVRPFLSSTPFRNSPSIFYILLLWITLGIIAEFLIPWMRKMFRPQDVSNRK
jgi:magnesium-transporting ATPase (P-type)